jgi:hypothetical protein
MATEQNIPTPWIGAEELPVHFANAFGVAVGANAIFLLVGSTVPAGGEGGPPFVPVKPIARLAIAPAAVPGLADALQGAVKAQKDAQAQA